MTHHSKGLIEENTMHYMKQECSQVMQIIAIIWLFLTVIHNISVKFFCKGPWLADNNITYNISKSPKNCSDYKVLYKCSSNYYHFSSRVTFIFVNRVIFAVFSVCEQLYFSHTSC